jgi:hypothetical protein
MMTSSLLPVMNLKAASHPYAADFCCDTLIFQVFTLSFEFPLLSIQFVVEESFSVHPHGW